MNQFIKSRAARLIAAAFPLVGAASDASADAITDWNMKAGDLITEAKIGTPPAIRVMAYAQTAVHEAVQASATGVSVDAAVAAANRAVFTKLLPAQQALVDKMYEAALVGIPDGAAKTAGIAAGERAAANVFAQRAKDAVAGESYRPHTAAGVYVPTAGPAVPTWSTRTPWLMTSASQFRAGPPPALASDAWVRDYNEVKELGAKASGKRSAEQTDIARFWEYSLPAIYHGAIRSIAEQPGRDVVRNARLFAAAAQAMDDAMIGVFEAKYHYHFWRPVTAIRNGDIDGNDATVRDAAWAPLIDAPMHPEYPSGHAILAGAVGAVLKADLGKSRPVIATASPSAKGAVRRWPGVDEFVREIGDSRIYAGMHFRSAIDAGTFMGERIGELAVTRLIAVD
jgi:membrane-associated phospholipid phosphatase